MTQFLPPNLLALFAPRDPIPYIAPADKLPHEKANNHLKLTGLARFLDKFEWEKLEDAPDKIIPETRSERRERKRRDKEERIAYQLEQEIAVWNPNENDACCDTDPIKTLFVGRLNYDVSESKVRREFEYYGPIKTIKMVKDKSGKPRGYCFIEFEHERDMRSAFKGADAMKIEGRRILVDVERGRTVKGWLPRRLGGGLGSTRVGKPEHNQRRSGRDEGSSRSSGRRRSRSRSRSEDRHRSRRRHDRSRSRSRDRSSRRRRSRSPDRYSRVKTEVDGVRGKRERSPMGFKSEKGLSAFGEGIELDPRFPSVKKEKLDSNGTDAVTARPPPDYAGYYGEY